MKITKTKVKELNKDGKVYMILLGCGGPEDDWSNGIAELLNKENVVDDKFKFENVYSFSNKGRTDIIFDCNNIDMGKLAIVRLKLRMTFGAMWLDDYIANGYLK